MHFKITRFPFVVSNYHAWDIYLLELAANSINSLDIVLQKQFCMMAL